ncbi:MULTISPECIES: helix-turn-helix domain-containing protein [unclassified Nocardioides]|uniref:LuxR family transcriptional regulator n=1 Tax=Nocardioides sp. URHA0032 TaxID=1380388 RepID=UPI000491059C|nr:LuxR family transcriptional regulator [Nocardioides sp. URHA0032]
MESYGPEERALFERAGAALFEEMVASAGLRADDPRVLPGGEFAEALDLLRHMGLAKLSVDGEQWDALDPSAVQSRVVSPLGQEGARLLSESSHWAHAFGPLTQAWRKAPQEISGGPFTYLPLEEIDPFIANLMAECEEEMLTAQPQALRDTKTMPHVVLRDTALLERGARIRTLYQHSARRNGVTREYVAQVTERGGEVRTVDEFFNRMIVVDRRVAIIPSKETVRVALVVRELSVVAYLVDVFERAWERGRPFTSREASVMKDIAAEQRSMTLRMLIEGHSDPVSAKRLGVSPRTYAGYISDLKEEFEAETRFQLGYTIGRRGITGRDEEDDAAEG